MRKAKSLNLKGDEEDTEPEGEEELTNRTKNLKIHE